jgi:predicted DNA-binding protein YlxM (UPF0122 family)
MAKPKINWDDLLVDYASGMKFSELATKYKISRQAIYQYFERNAISRKLEPNISEISRIAIDDRYSKMHVLYSQLADIQNAVEECSANLKRSQFQMMALFRHMETLREALSDIHDTHIRKTIADLRSDLRGDIKPTVLDDDPDGTT